MGEMMNKYKTAAYEVKSEIDSLIMTSSFLNKPWQLLDYKIMSRTLLATYEELGGIYKANASERLGFEVSEDMVYIPSLFVKLSGSHTFTSDLEKDEGNCHSNFISRFDTISDFNCNKDDSYVFDPVLIQNLFGNDGLLEKDKVLESSLFKYSFLKREYQEIIIDKINYVISERNNLFLEHASSTPLEIAYALLTIDQNIIGMFNNFDFMNMVPKVIIRNEDKAAFSNSQAYVLALLNQLSYDIVIISENGYADVENVINENNFSIFYGLQKDKKALKRKEAEKAEIISKYKKVAITALAVAAVFTGGILLNNASMHIKDYALKQVNTIAAKVNKEYTPITQYSSNTLNSMPNQTIKIVSITPSGPLKAGVETDFIVVVDYNMTGRDNLVLNIGVNDGKSSLGKYFTQFVPVDVAKPEERLYIKNTIPLDKEKLKGRYTLNFKATPVKWDNKSFQVQAAVMDMSIQLPRRTVSRSIHTFEVTD